jgi:cytochrome c oxidase subunit 1
MGPTETPAGAGSVRLRSDHPATTEAYQYRSSRLPDRVLELTRSDGRLVLAYMVAAFTALLLGAVAGLLQALQHSGHVSLPSWLGYYQLLTAHGVLMALVFTTFFIFGFLYSGMAVTLEGELIAGAKGLGWIAFWLMVLGGLIATVPILSGDANVLYTFYAPMQASPWYYVGLTLFVVGSWVAGWGIFTEYALRRKMTKTQVTPLFAFMAVTTCLLWQVATLGVAAEMLLQLIPWSFGWTPTINVLLSRTLFWFFGHPLVYFWILPAYMAWYLVLPRLIGGRVFSDSLARMSFLLLLVLSVPVGLHHQLMEPGLSETAKTIQVGLTLAVVIPSLMTAFALFATLERAGRARGHRGALGWLKGLPWRDARFLALFVGMFVFIPGGAGGIVNASLNLNGLVHNTMWVTGHFHLTVATAAALTFIGVGYWLVPHAAGRSFTKGANRVAVAQVLLWAIGMGVMSTAQHIGGILGIPRRTAYIDTSATDPIVKTWKPYEMGMAIGGTVLFVSVLLAVGTMAYLAFRAPRTERASYPLADADPNGTPPPAWLERWRYWLGALAFLIIAAYSAPLIHVMSGHPYKSKPIDSTHGAVSYDAPKATPAPKPADSMAGMPGMSDSGSSSSGVKLGEATTTAPPAAEAGTMVDAALGEFYVKTDAKTAPAGHVTFVVHDTGNVPHEFVVVKTDTPEGKLPQSGGKADETGSVGEVGDVTPGSTKHYLTLDLKPGKYVLLCNVAGHYAAGQHTAFTVT